MALSRIFLLRQVSIPLWFDSNEDHRELGEFWESMFQFHSGSIQTEGAPLPTLDHHLFQFHSGSIQTMY